MSSPAAGLPAVNDASHAMTRSVIHSLSHTHLTHVDKGSAEFPLCPSLCCVPVAGASMTRGAMRREL